MPPVTSDMIECPWCGEATRLEYIAGHMACMRCKRVISDCCDGETAD